MRERAYAKINLFLDVLRKREDGFHDIKTVMQTVTLYDNVDVFAERADKTEITVNVPGTTLPCDRGNLAYRAADLYLQAADISANVHISIDKHIPVAAGLAGGSADAAATLRALNAIFSLLSQEKLLDIALMLGSDVPFCLVGGTRLCEGRGERMSVLRTPAAHLVIAIGDERISTPAAFARLDERFSSFDGSVTTGGEDILDKLLAGIDVGEIRYDGLLNVFEIGVDENSKSVSKIKAEMICAGAKAAMMSGSGPSVVGFFVDKASALEAQKKIASKGYFAAYAMTI